VDGETQWPAEQQEAAHQKIGRRHAIVTAKLTKSRQRADRQPNDHKAKKQLPRFR
jgi:hypothetical protein